MTLRWAGTGHDPFFLIRGSMHMNVSTMRWVDAWVGVPCCLLASCLRLLVRTFRGTPPAAQKPRSILVIKLSELGALITLGPAFRSMAEMVGRENLYFLTFDESRGLLDLLDYVPSNNVFAVKTHSLAGLIWSGLHCVVQIRARRVQCSVDLDFFSRATALLALLSGCRDRVGCHAFFGEGPYRGDLLTHRVKYNPHVHVSRMFEILAMAASLPPGDLPRMDYAPGPAEAPGNRFRPNPGELAAVRRVLAATGVETDARVILFNPNISDRETIPLRKWSDERYAELARLVLAGIPDAFVLLTGSAKEVETIARLESRIGHPRCRSVAGKTSLRELLALFSISSAIVTNDSGPAHFATLTDITAVVLFGPETPLLWRPLGERVTVVYRGLACSPCFTVSNGRRSTCRRNVCMDIRPADVFEIVRDRLAGELRPAGKDLGPGHS